MYTKGYVPKVLVAGDVEAFRARLGADRAVKVLGRVEFVGNINGKAFNCAEDRTLAINGQLADMNALKGMIAQGLIDYVIFLNNDECNRYSGELTGSSAMYEFFERNIFDRFYTYTNDQLLFKILDAPHTSTPSIRS